MGYELLWILLVVSAVLCAVGFYKYVYFLNVGYGLSVAGIGIAVLVLGLCGKVSLSVPLAVLGCLLAVYGLRLGLFVLHRDLKSASYKKTMEDSFGKKTRLPIFVSLFIWIFVSVLYVLQTSPLFFRAYNAKTAGTAASSAMIWVGVVIAACAIVLEATADAQKTAQKKENPGMVATKGLYRIVRCPNYFAEILFWTGVFLSGVDIYRTAGQWICAAIGYVCIVFIMFNGAQRLEKRQNGRYGSNEEYVKYVNSTPIILPLIPLYHLVKKDGKEK